MKTNNITPKDIDEMLNSHPAMLDVNTPEGKANAEELRGAEITDIPENEYPNIPDLNATPLRALVGMFQLRKIYDSPLSRHAFKDIYESQEYVTKEFKRIWQGDVPYDSKHWRNLSRKVNDQSIEAVFERTSDNDAAAVARILNTSIKQKLYHKQTRDLFKSQMTPKQLEFFDSLTDYYKKLFKATRKIQDRAGIPAYAQLPFKRGWFHAHRSGRYFSRIMNKDGHTVRFETFNTKAEG